MHVNGNQSSEADATRILEQRAMELATAKSRALPWAYGLDFVEFIIADECYGIELNYIREVYAIKRLTRLPGVPAFIAGIINVRGTIVSIVNLKQHFGIPETEITGKRHIIILSSSQMEFGLLVDRIIGVRKLPVSALKPPIKTLAGVRARYLKGIIESRIALLDGQQLLEDDNLRIGREEDAE